MAQPLYYTQKILIENVVDDIDRSELENVFIGPSTSLYWKTLPRFSVDSQTSSVNVFIKKGTHQIHMTDS